MKASDFSVSWHDDGTAAGAGTGSMSTGFADRERKVETYMKWSPMNMAKALWLEGTCLQQY